MEERSAVVSVGCLVVLAVVVAGCGRLAGVSESTPMPATISLVSERVYKDENGDEAYDGEVGILMPRATVSVFPGNELVGKSNTDDQG